MARPHSPGFEETKHLRMSPAEKAEWTRAGLERGMDLSMWMREVCNAAARIHVNQAPAWIPPPPAQVRQALPPGFRERLYAAGQGNPDLASPSINSLAALEVLVANGINPQAIINAVAEWVPGLPSPLKSWTEPWLTQAYTRAQAKLDAIPDVVSPPRVIREPPVSLTDDDLDPPEPVPPKPLRAPSTKVGEPRRATQAELSRRGHPIDREEIQAPFRNPLPVTDEQFDRGPERPTAAGLDWGELVAGYKAGAVQWDKRLGPEPGQPGCRAPPAVLNEEGY